MALGTGRIRTVDAARRARRSLAVAAVGASAVAGLSLASAAPASAKGTTSGRALVIKTVHIPSVGTVLATSTGRTLYRFADGAAETAMCTGVCAKEWPPLLLPKGDTKLKAPRGVKGFSLQRVARGRTQVSFRHEALFRFAGDTKKGQAKGQGIENLWYAVLSDGRSSAPKAATTSHTPVAGTGATTTSKPATNSTQATTPPTTAPMTATSAPATTRTPTTSPPTTTPPRSTTTTTSPPPTTTTTTAPPSGGAGF